MKRTLKDLLPKSASLKDRLRRVLTTGTAATVGIGSAAAQPAPSVKLPSVEGITIENRAQKVKKLILHLPDGNAFRMLQHKSHSSHSSHKSHSSHYSSSSGGSSIVAPRKATPAPPAKSTLLETPPPIADVAQRWLSGTIDAIDVAARTFTIKQPMTGAKYTLGYRDDTSITTAAGVASRLDDASDRNNGSVPLTKGEKVRVAWKDGASVGKYIALSVIKVP